MGDNYPTIVRALAKLAGADEALERKEPFVVTIDDVAIRIEYTTGSTPTVMLSTPYSTRSLPNDAGLRQQAVPIFAARPLDIALALETDGDRKAKLKKISCEAETGDVDFDREVYIDTFSEQPVVSAVLASPALRRGVRLLLADGFEKIVIDDERGDVRTMRGSSLPARADGIEIARAFAAIASQLPVIEQRGTWRTRRWLAILSLVALFCAPTAVIVALVLSPVLVVGVGTLGGALVGGGVGIGLGRTHHGGSNSHWRVRAIIIGATGVGVLAGIVVSFVVNGASAWVIGGFVAIPLVVAASLAVALRDSNRS